MSDSSGKTQSSREFRLQMAALLYFLSRGALVVFFAALPAVYLLKGQLEWPLAAGAACGVLILFILWILTAGSLRCVACTGPVLMDGGRKLHPYAKKLPVLGPAPVTAWQILTQTSYQCPWCHTKCRSRRHWEAAGEGALLMPMAAAGGVSFAPQPPEPAPPGGATAAFQAPAPVRSPESLSGPARSSAPVPRYSPVPVQTAPAPFPQPESDFSPHPSQPTDTMKTSVTPPFQFKPSAPADQPTPPWLSAPVAMERAVQPPVASLRPTESVPAFRPVGQEASPFATQSTPAQESTLASLFASAAAQPVFPPAPQAAAPAPASLPVQAVAAAASAPVFPPPGALASLFPPPGPPAPAANMNPAPAPVPAAPVQAAPVPAAPAPFAPAAAIFPPVAAPAAPVAQSVPVAARLAKSAHLTPPPELPPPPVQFQAPVAVQTPPAAPAPAPMTFPPAAAPAAEATPAPAPAPAAMTFPPVAQAAPMPMPAPQGSPFAQPLPPVVKSAPVSAPMPFPVPQESPLRPVALPPVPVGFGPPPVPVTAPVARALTAPVPAPMPPVFEEMPSFDDAFTPEPAPADPFAGQEFKECDAEEILMQEQPPAPVVDTAPQPAASPVSAALPSSAVEDLIRSLEEGRRSIEAAFGAIVSQLRACAAPAPAAITAPAPVAAVQPEPVAEIVETVQIESAPVAGIATSPAISPAPVQAPAVASQPPAEAPGFPSLAPAVPAAAPDAAPARTRRYRGLDTSIADQLSSALSEAFSSSPPPPQRATQALPPFQVMSPENRPAAPATMDSPFSIAAAAPQMPAAQAASAFPHADELLREAFGALPMPPQAAGQHQTNGSAAQASPFSLSQPPQAAPLPVWPPAPAPAPAAEAPAAPPPPWMNPAGRTSLS